MNRSARQSTSQRFIEEIQLARTRLERSENNWHLADDQARTARRRRRDAKLSARRARKKAKRAKRELAAAKEALTALEEQFSAAVERAATNQKLRRARLAARARAGAHRRTGPRMVRRQPARRTAGQITKAVLRPSGEVPLPPNNALNRAELPPVNTAVVSTVRRKDHELAHSHD